MKLLFIGTYPPTRCGIATFTQHLRQGILTSHGLRDANLPVTAILPNGEDIADTPALADKFHHRGAIRKHVVEDYLSLAEKINASDVDVISLQHEFGIFGGEAGEYIVLFLEAVKKPVVTTFHTVFETPVEPYKHVQEEIIKRSDRIVVMNRLAIDYLTRHFPVTPDKIFYVPHGAPTPPDRPRDEIRRMYDMDKRKVLLTFGLLSPGKGIEMLLQVLPEVVKEVPDLLYVIAGQTHPEVKKKFGEQYREQLQQWVKTNHLENNVRFIDRYLSEEELSQLLVSCDLYVTPYPGMQQITSGTLAYAVGLGRPVLTTPYAHARDLLQPFPELLISYDQPNKWREQLIRLLTENGLLAKYEQSFARLGAEMSWPAVGQKFYRLCQDLIPSEVMSRA